MIEDDNDEVLYPRETNFFSELVDKVPQRPERLIQRDFDQVWNHDGVRHASNNLRNIRVNKVDEDLSQKIKELVEIAGRHTHLKFK